MECRILDFKIGVSLTDRFHAFLLSQGLRPWEDCILYKDKEAQCRCVQEFFASINGNYTKNNLWRFCSFVEKNLDVLYIIEHDVTDVELVGMLKGRRAFRRMKAAYKGYYIGLYKTKELNSKNSI